MQIDPIKPVLKAPGSECLILSPDELLSSFAFKFVLRRYTEASDATTDITSVHSAPSLSRMTTSSIGGGALARLVFFHGSQGGSLVPPHTRWLGLYQRLDLS